MEQVLRKEKKDEKTVNWETPKKIKERSFLSSCWPFTEASSSPKMGSSSWCQMPKGRERQTWKWWPTSIIHLIYRKIHKPLDTLRVWGHSFVVSHNHEITLLTSSFRIWFTWEWAPSIASFSLLQNVLLAMVNGRINKCRNS